MKVKLLDGKYIFAVLPKASINPPDLRSQIPIRYGLPGIENNLLINILAFSVAELERAGRQNESKSIGWEMLFCQISLLCIASEKPCAFKYMKYAPNGVPD